MEARHKILLAAAGLSFTIAYLIRRKQLSVVSYDSPEIRQLSFEDLAFLMRWKGLQLDEQQTNALRNQVIKVWQEIKQVAHTYRCVQTMTFLNPKVTELEGYRALITEAKAQAAERKPFPWLDIGCAFGQNTRALVADGVSPEEITVADIHDRYWQAGYRLYGDSETKDAAMSLRGVHTVFGDWAVPLTSEEASVYGNKFRAIICMSVLHVLSKAQCKALLERLAVCGASGCRLLGLTGGAKSPTDWARTPDGSAPRFLHSAASLKQALQEAGWSEVQVTEEEKRERKGEDATGRLRLAFSAKKL